MVVFATTFIIEVTHLLDGSSLFLIQFQAARLTCMQALSRENRHNAGDCDEPCDFIS